MACNHATCGECVKEGCGWNGKCVPAGEAGSSSKCAVYANTFISPKPSADSLEGVGSVGYVDMDNRTMKKVNPENVKWADNYTVYQTAGRHSEMKNCTPPVRYGDIVTLMTDQGQARVGKFGVVEVRGKASKFLVRPQKGSDLKDGTTVKYGEAVVLTTTTALNDEKCGVYGCGVGQIVDGHYVVGEGGINGGTGLKMEWKGKLGEITYGDPFYMVAETLKAKVVGRKIMFGDEGDKFGFGPLKACDVKALQGMCGTDCAGILLSPSTNEYQMLLPGASYQTSTTEQVAYVKPPKLMMEDPSCQGGIHPVESSIFSGFQITGQLRSKGMNQCAPGDTTKINDLMRSVLPSREGFDPETPSFSSQRQVVDWGVLESQNMARTALWAVLLVGVVAASWKAVTSENNVT